MADVHYMEMGWSGSGWMDPLPTERPPAPAPTPAPALPASPGAVPPVPPAPPAPDAATLLDLIKQHAGGPKNEAPPSQDSAEHE